MLTTPLVIVNFKTYPQATGERAVELAQICEKVSQKSGIQIAVAVQAADIFRVSNAVMIPVLAQHVDAVEPDRNTGKITAKSIKESGAVGTLLNHSEDRVDMKIIEAAISIASKLDLQTVVCAENPGEVAKISRLSTKPDFIAIEPPELIAGKVSISTAKPEVISDSLDVSSVPILAGAGVQDDKDVRIAMELGAKGILLASAITKSKNPEKDLMKLVEGFK